MTTFNAINNALPELNINASTTVNGIINDSTMATATSTNLSTSSAIKTYIDNQAATTGSLKLLATQTASSSANLTFNGYFTSSYDDYLLTFDAIIPATNATFLYLQLGTGAGPTIITANYFWNVTYGIASTCQNSSSFSDSKVFCTENGHGIKNSTSSAGFCGTLMLYGFNGNSNPGVGTGNFAYLNNDAEYITARTSFLQAAAVFTAIQFSMSSGNITSGVIKLYGLKNS